MQVSLVSLKLEGTSQACPHMLGTSLNRPVKRRFISDLSSWLNRMQYLQVAKAGEILSNLQLIKCLKSIKV